MAEVNTEGGGGGGGKHQKQRAKKSSTKIDMTPMVDLAFLLLTFFILTSTFNKPKTMELTMPYEKAEEKTKINNAITLLLSEDDKIFWYFGELKPEETKFEKTDYSANGVRKLLLDRNKWTVDEVNLLEDKVRKKEIADSTFKRLRNEVWKNKQSLTVVVKADDKASYKNVIDVLDEVNIADVGKFALVKQDSIEVEMIKQIP